MAGFINRRRVSLLSVGAAAAAIALMLPAALAGETGSQGGLLRAPNPGQKACAQPVWFGTLAGNWACQVEAPSAFLAPAPVMVGNASVIPPASTAPVKQLIQIEIPPGCSPITGTLFHEAGENCDIPISGGALSIGADDIGSLSVTLNIGTLYDEDNDVQCSTLFGGQTSLSENFHVVLSRSHGEMMLAGMEDFVSPAPPEGGELAVPVSGRCIRQ